ncbi:hypothetical protein P4V43_00325 [Brevibacillus fortis]|uniref:hypothetical protein n=1 Tax=Brevibacillus fortis TaxID=2126352 RepID=UPI002E20F91B|nr:hypothetical protein [Brevibacillus fortis]
MSSLREINQKSYLIKIYLLPLVTGTIGTEEAVNFLGLREYPITSTPTNDPIKIYRYIGTREDALNCDSTILIATRLTPKPEILKCNGEQVLSLMIPFEDQIPYMDITYGDSLIDDFEVIKGYRKNLCIGNHTQMDFWFEWFRDVHTDHHLDFVPHGGEKERKSRKTATTATFPVKVYKNNAGEKGEYLGEFFHEVYKYDYVECIVVNISGQQYFQVISLIQTPLKVLLSVLIG